MTLFPWPQTDGASSARQDVLWNRSDSSRPRGLLTDSLAVPVRFVPELADEGAPAEPAPSAMADAAERELALQRAREFEQLLVTR